MISHDPALSTARARTEVGRRMNATPSEIATTMAFLLYVFIILHIITAAAWFGLGLRVAGRARQAVTAERATGMALSEDVSRTIHLMTVFIVLTFVFSLAAFFIGGGFRTYGPRPEFHIALSLILLFVLLQVLLIQGTWRKIASGLKSNAPEVELTSHSKRLAMGVGIGHLLWLVLLVLMFWQQLSATLGA
jgi:hypothetical protein